MALRVRIVAVFFLFCAISPLLASAYSNAQGKEPIRNENNALPKYNSGRVPGIEVTDQGLSHQENGEDFPPQDPRQANNGEDLPPQDPRQANNGEDLPPQDPHQANNGEDLPPQDPRHANNGEDLPPQDPRQANNDEDIPRQVNGEDREGPEILNPLRNRGVEKQRKQEEEEEKEEETPEGLKINFYRQSCPAAAEIIKRVFTEALAKDVGIGASLVRLFSHDCFVQGCDASVLLDRNPNGQPTEKMAAANGQFIRGTEVIDQIKNEVEKACPGIVSCADILALSTRDALVSSGLPNFDIPLGRRDGLTSIKDRAEHDLPIPTDNVNQMIDLFQQKGLNVEDLATLIGAHSIGTAHCASFGYRTQNPQKTEEMNPKMPLSINHMCWNNMATLPIDSSSHFQMDSLFYKGLLDRTGLLESDHIIAFDPRTSNYVKKYAGNQNDWHEKFIASLIKMSRIGVLTGNAGQVRKQCRLVN